MVSELLQKYIWLIQTFVKASDRGLSIEEICRKWENRFGTGYSRRTFNNHRTAIDDAFGIKIECNRSSNRYYVKYSDDVADGNAAAAWLINTFTVNNILSLGKERLSGRVSVEDIPSGHRHLTSIMDAMLDGSEIRIGYRKYTSSGKAAEYTLRPYAIKESARRWYLVAHCMEKDAVRVYGLDRITGLTTTGNEFRMPEDFDVDTLFATSYGVYLSDDKPCEIMLKASAKEAGYLRDLPLHSSQKEIGKDGEDVIFSIYVCPNTNLMMDLWRLGNRIEIISPENIRKAFAAEAAKALSIYGGSQE
ncbi:MAG: WYL domain-containing protein [Bacteroidales bacterium]|nr:WYL domain-containing protein [Bacteroidales bacterium]MDE6871126.1 WYL domain-containing protein [Bacteroidales bacterium]